MEMQRDRLDQTEGVLSNRVAEYLMNWIKDNGLEPGDKIPPELELVKILNTGRSSVREALALLKSRRVVEVRRGHGTFLCEQPGVVNDPFGMELLPKDESLAQDWGIVRLIIEPPIAELAAIYATPEDIDNLMESWEYLTNNRDDPVRHFEADSEFHRLLAVATHNAVIMRLFPVIQEGIQRFLTASDSVNTEDTRRLHHEILKAVVTHDAAKARSAMEELICVNQNLLNS